MITTAALTPPRRAAVRSLAELVTAHDGAGPLDEAALLALEDDSALHLILEDASAAGHLIGYASVLTDGTVQGMVDPAQRRRGHGSALLAASLERRPDAGVWAHGALEGSLAFLAAAGLHETRRLLTLRRALGADHPVPPTPSSTLEGLMLDRFREDRDASGWVAVNARAFADHPEQGALTGQDLARRLDQPWFDARDMLVARRGEELVGFVWVKREHPGATAADAEIYVVATDPSVQGHGVAAQLLAASLEQLAQDGVPGVELYVEADNTAALRLYERWGFAVSGRDVQMRAATRG
ncbi:mycothiol synthase [Brachybacterium sp. YJGR34]|uniref:mycothiol synthase n=1 Tax=Brachybacterium sp. YJGR34 TaxID=2059911 RepID=UPI000E0AB677|nr:mycothiol synthase [Brachybacterium sp. YJGR34]